MELAPMCEVDLIHPEHVRQAQADLIEAETAAILAETFEALADPNRVRLISALLGQELCVCDLAAVLGMSQSAVSHQLRYLRALHLVRARKEGRVVYYNLDDEHIRDLFQRGLEHVRHTETKELL
jgi:ArsR family transcriptional regulator, lead/cadmium/zinc/bismuth-responsive transcriptional repressor